MYGKGSPGHHSSLPPNALVSDGQPTATRAKVAEQRRLFRGIKADAMIKQCRRFHQFWGSQCQQKFDVDNIFRVRAVFTNICDIEALARDLGYVETSAFRRCIHAYNIGSTQFERAKQMSWNRYCFLQNRDADSAKPRQSANNSASKPKTAASSGKSSHPKPKKQLAVCYYSKSVFL
jgi:hypothetical protein